MKQTPLLWVVPHFEIKRKKKNIYQQQPSMMNTAIKGSASPPLFPPASAPRQLWAPCKCWGRPHRFGPITIFGHVFFASCFVSGGVIV